MGWASRMQGVVTTAGVKVIPWIPTAAQRALVRGRAVIIDGNTLDPTLQLMLTGLHAVGIDGLVVDDDAAASRAQMREMTLSFPGPQIHVEVDEIMLPGPGGEIAARHYRPPNGAAAPLLVFYHGGGWTIGDLDTADALCRLTCRDAGIHVLSIDYRLAPEHAAPAAIEDAYAAFNWAYEHAGELGAIPGRVAVGGDSAGGNLAAIVCQLARDDGGPAPVLQWLIYPRTDFTAQTRSLSLFARGFLLTKRDMDWFESQYLRRSAVDPGGPADFAAAGRVAVRAGAGADRGRGFRPVARRRQGLRDGAAGRRDRGGPAVHGFADPRLRQPVPAWRRQRRRDQRTDFGPARSPEPGLIRRVRTG